MTHLGNCYSFCTTTNIQLVRFMCTIRCRRSVLDYRFADNCSCWNEAKRYHFMCIICSDASRKACRVQSHEKRKIYHMVYWRRGCRRRLKIWNLFVCRSRATLFPRQSTARKRGMGGSVVGGLRSWLERRVYAYMFRGSIARGGRATNQARMIDEQKRTVRCIRRRIWNKRCVNTCCRPLKTSSLKRRVMIPYNTQVFDVQSEADRAASFVFTSRHQQNRIKEVTIAMHCNWRPPSRQSFWTLITGPQCTIVPHFSNIGQTAAELLAITI